MTIRNILVPICPSVPFDRQLEAALNLARSLEAHINAVYLRPDSAATMSSIPAVAMAPGFTVDRLDRDDRAVEAAAQAKFEAWRQKNSLASGVIHQSLSTTYACWSNRAGYLEANLVRCGRLSDLIVLNYPDPNLIATERAFDTATFETGRPTIFVREWIPDYLLRHVMVAWNGSLEGTRAVAATMTLLHEAEEVSIFVSPGHSEDSLGELDLVDALRWHGIGATRLTPPAGSASVGAALLAAAQEKMATLIVMGAYTHSRVRQMFLGGVTAHVLQHADIPCLMMH
jgi:nucleotide-binding universal stress UspA family protein